MTETTPEVKHAVEMARVEMTLEIVQKTLEDINSTLKDIKSMDSKMGQILIENSNMKNEMTIIWDKYDKMNLWREEVNEQLNKSHGARSIINLVLSFVQLLIIGIGSYVALELIRGQRINDVQDSRIQALETRLK